jgi:hypothetical protein
MFYEKKSAAPLPSKTVQLPKQHSALKGSSSHKGGASPQKASLKSHTVIKDALREQEQRYRDQLEAKERQIRQQKEIMGR